MRLDIVTHNPIMFKAHHPLWTLNCSNMHLIHQTGDIVIRIVYNTLGDMQ